MARTKSLVGRMAFALLRIACWKVELLFRALLIQLDMSSAEAEKELENECNWYYLGGWAGLVLFVAAFVTYEYELYQLALVLAGTYTAAGVSCYLFLPPMFAQRSHVLPPPPGREFFYREGIE